MGDQLAKFDILNYTTTLIGWAQSTSLPSNISFNGGDNLYQSAFNAYKKLTQTYNWTFIPVPVFIPTPALDVQYNEPTTQYLLLNEAMLAYQPVYLSEYTDLVFTVAPPLNVGLNINASTGLISGTPTVLTVAQSYTVKTTANNGAIQATNSLTFAVSDLVSYSTLIYTFVKDTLITPIVPTVATGRIISIYAISPALPEGLVFDTTLGTITGTPTTTLTTTIYTITAVYDNISYVNRVSLTINLSDPFILQFVNVPVNFVIALPLYVALISTTFKVNWGDGSSETTNILTYKYNNQSITSYTVQLYILTGTIDTFGELNWPGMVYLKTITDWDNLPGIRKLRGIGGAALTSVPDSLPNTVRDISYMFSGATQFNQDLSSWDVSEVLEMSAVFQNASSFNQPLNGWQVGNVEDMSFMFRDAINFNQPLNNWNVGKVVNIESMFSGAINFNQPLNDWDVSKVVSMSFLFYMVKNFNQDLSAWNVSRVIDMRSVFSEAPSFNQDLSSWDVSSATQMSYMFYQCTSFNQNLSKWNVSQVKTMDNMFTDATSFDVSNYSATLTGWASLPTLQNNVPLTGGSALYQAAQSAYTQLITAPYVWQITPVPTFLPTPALSIQYNQSTTRAYKTNSAIIPYQPTVYSMYSDVFFSITPALPSGLSIDASNGTISGTPNVFSPQATYKVNATANAGQLSMQILLRFLVASDFYYPSNSVFLNNVLINPLQPTVATGITISSYAITPNLSSGLNFNTISGAITGTPTTAILSQNYTITGTKPNKTIATYPITLSVADISYANMPYVYAQNVEFLYSPFNGKPIIPTRYDADFFNSIVLNTPLPVELAIDLSDGIIYGIPYTATPQKNYILTATTISGYSKDIKLSITVNGFSYTEDGSELVYTLNVFNTVKIVVLINVGGYTDFISYPNLPAGLTLDNATGSIFGTVTAQDSSTEVYFISGLVQPVITIPITIIIKSNNYPPVCQYKCPPLVDIPRPISTINTNAMRYSTLVRTGLGQTRFIATSGTNINATYTEPVRNKF